VFFNQQKCYAGGPEYGWSFELNAGLIKFYVQANANCQSGQTPSFCYSGNTISSAAVRELNFSFTLPLSWEGNPAPDRVYSAYFYNHSNGQWFASLRVLTPQYEVVYATDVALPAWFVLSPGAGAATGGYVTANMQVGTWPVVDGAVCETLPENQRPTAPSCQQVPQLLLNDVIMEVKGLKVGRGISPVSSCSSSITFPSIPTTVPEGVIQRGTNPLSAPAGCEWDVHSSDSWITLISGAASQHGIGSDTVGYNLSPNFLSRSRLAFLTVNGAVRGTVAQSSATGAPMERYVKLLYYSFLGRVPAAQEIAGQLSTGFTPAQLATSFFNSQEFNAKGRFAAGL